MSPSQRSNLDAVFQRVERYGLPLTILIGLAWWGRPHVDGLINDMRASMKKTAEAVQVQSVTQARQAEISAVTRDNTQITRDRVDRIGEKVETIHGIVKELKHGGNVAIGPQTEE